MIIGDKVRFRLPESEHDHQLMVNWRNDPAIKPFFYNDEPVSLESHLKWWAKVSNDPTQRNYIIDAIDNPETHTPIGMTALMNIDPVNRTGEYARFKIDPQHQGKGYAYAAEMLLLKHAFESLNLNKVWLHAFTDNNAVIKLHEKTGFHKEGILREHVFKSGCYRDVIQMAILASEYREKAVLMMPEWQEHYSLG